MMKSKTQMVKEIVELVKIVAKTVNLEQLQRIYKYIVYIYRQ